MPSFCEVVKARGGVLLSGGTAAAGALALISNVTTICAGTSGWSLATAAGAAELSSNGTTITAALPISASAGIAITGGTTNNYLQIQTGGTAGTTKLTVATTTWQFGGTSSTISEAGAATFATSVTSPTIYGGTAAGSDLTLIATSNGSPSGANIYFGAAGALGSVAETGACTFGSASSGVLSHVFQAGDVCALTVKSGGTAKYAQFVLSPSTTGKSYLDYSIELRIRGTGGTVDSAIVSDAGAWSFPVTGVQFNVGGQLVSGATGISGTVTAGNIAGTTAQVANGTAIHGITGTANGRILFLTATSGSFTILHNSGSAAAGEKMATSTAGTITCTAGAVVIYDSSRAAWCVVSYA